LLSVFQDSEPKGVVLDALPLAAFASWKMPPVFVSLQRLAAAVLF
jgi:hypothetical protein